MTPSLPPKQPKIYLRRSEILRLMEKIGLSRYMFNNLFGDGSAARKCLPNRQRPVYIAVAVYKILGIGNED